MDPRVYDVEYAEKVQHELLSKGYTFTRDINEMDRFLDSHRNGENASCYPEYHRELLSVNPMLFNELNVGQDLVESIFSFVHYKPIPVIQLIQASLTKSEPDQEGFINLGWRGWEGAFPTSFIRGCSANPTLDEKTIAYYNEAVKTSEKRIQPITSYFHKDPRPDKFGGTALTGVHSYMGNEIPELTGSGKPKGGRIHLLFSNCSYCTVVGDI